MRFNIFKMITVGLLPSFMKVMYYRMKGARIEGDVKIGLLSIIDAKDISIGRGTRISMLCSFKGEVLRIGKRADFGMMFICESREIYIGNDSKIGEQVLVGAYPTPRSRIIMGQRVNILPFCILNPSDELFIGNNTLIGGRSCLFTHASAQSVFEGYPVLTRSLKIENNVWIGWNVTVTVNAGVIGRGAMVKAGAVVAGSIDRNVVAAGVPAKSISSRQPSTNKPDADEKFDLLINIFRELAEFIRLDSVEITEESMQDGVVFSYVMDGSERRVFLPKGNINEAVACNVVCSIDRIIEKQQIQLNEQGVIWFDISRYATGYSTDSHWITLRDWFLRYGVRFRVEEI